MPNAEPLVLALLQALSRSDDPRPVRLEGNVLFRGMEPVLASESRSQGYGAKVAYLARRLGLEGVPPEELTAAWAAALAGGRERAPRELLEVVRRSDRPDETEDVQRRWRAAVEPMLAQITLPAGMVETLGPAAPPEDLALRLELRPILEEWPGRLLRDPWWSTAEAPLPGMKPLSLDEVWVDLQVLDPEEGPALAGRETLRALLDQRFEERRWRAEPLELILERLSGITAFIGPPGSGKTTLLKWIARQLVMRPGESRFLLPLFVPLRSYVLRKREGQEDSLLRCALRECGVRRPEQQWLWLHDVLMMSDVWRDRVLVLLDGWDEVPVEERVSLLDEVRTLAYGFSVLVTSRPAAFSSRLAASCVYEVADLSPDASDTLIRRWFRGVDAPEQADALVRHLDLHPDLRRLVRNPFLLTLLCGISHLTRRREGVDLPTSRAALYRETLRLVYAHHNERYPHLPLGSERERQIERLALWLLDEAPGAPRFVFGPPDVTASGADADLLPHYLQPSRLLGRLAPEEDSHHFLHATFQEYLAACALERTPEGKALRSLRTHVNDASWQEVFHFLAANAGPLRDAFWREMSRQAAHPDRFGIVPAKLARWVAAAGARDGGAALLGRDLRDLLWPLIERLARNRLWIEAYAELDAPGFVARATQASQAADPRRKANLQRALGRVRSPVASNALVDQILGKDPQAAAVAASQLHLRIDEDGLRRLRAAATSPEVSLAVRRQAIQALGYGRDGIALSSLLQLIQGEPALADEAVRAIGRIGGSEATAALAGLLGETGSLAAVVVRALGEMHEAAARDALLDELARRDAGDPLLLPLLDALSELPIHRGSELIMEWLEGPPGLRRAALWALAEATGPGVYEKLIAGARDDPEEEVRLAALEVLERRAKPTESSWLLQRVEDETRSLAERAYALRALLGGAGRKASLGEEPQALRMVELVLSDLEGDLALEALLYAHHAGPGVAPRLMEICLDPRASPSVRESACTALGKLEFAGAREALLSLVRAAPDADDDEDQPLEAGADRVARAAAEALTRIDVASLLREPGTTAEHALARFSIETGALVFDSHVLGPDGREWARVPVREPKPVARSHPPRSTPMRHDGLLAVDLEIEVSPHTVNGELVLHYSVTSPSGVVQLSFRKTQTQPLGSLEAYRDQVVRRVEKYQRGSHAADGLLLAKEVEQELRTLGQELYQQLFPPEMRLLYRQWRDEVHTIQITSGEGWIPWELVRPYDHEIQPVIDDDYLGARYQITRWLPSGRSPAPQFRIQRAACIEGGEEGTPLPAAEREKRFLEDLVRSLGVEVVSPRQATFGEVLKIIEQEESDLLHFVGHGEYSAKDPRASKIFLVDGTSLWAGRLQGAILRKVWERRPLVFFNACSTGQQGWALVGPSGWVQAWVGIGGAGAFIAPQWQVQDELAYELARLFYLALFRGRTLGQAARLARWWARRQDPLDSTWLAFAVYGHPNARVSFGLASEAKTGDRKARSHPLSRGREPGREALIASLRRSSDRARKSLEPYLLPRIPRREVHQKYLPAIRESVAQRKSRVIPILGSAGFGKSTLLGEIYDGLRGENVSWTGLIDGAEISLAAPTDLPLALCRTLCDTDMPFAALFAELSRHGPGVLLIDTLDLVLSPAVIPQLRRLLFGLEDTATTVVFTCRDVDYQFLLEPPRQRLPEIADRVDRYMVPAFTPPEVALAARAFVDTNPRLRGTLAGETFVERLQSLSADSRPLQSITSNPLLLAMLCEVFGQEGDLPRDLTVSELYERYWDEKVARSRKPGTADPVMIEKPRICLNIARHLVKQWNELGQDWIAESDLALQGSTPVAQARAELLSDGILKTLGSGRLRFFHQTFLEYVMARWLTTGSGTVELEKILGAVRRGENVALHWWPVLRQLLVLVEPAVFAVIVDQFPLANPVAFRTVSFATVARAEPRQWGELLQKALDLGEEFQKTLCVAAENAPARFLSETWTMLEALLRSAGRSVAMSATATVGALLAREKDMIAERLRKMLDALAARARSEGDRGEDTEITGQLLRACLPVLSTTADPEVFELLQTRYRSFASRGKGLVIDLFRSDPVGARQREQFVQFLFTQPREKHLPAESLVALVEQTLRAEIPGDNLTTAVRLEILFRPVPEAWVSYHARAVARLFPGDPRLISEVARDYFSPQSLSPHCNTSFLEEVACLGQADQVCHALAELPHETLSAGRMPSLTTLARELTEIADTVPRQKLARWLQPLAIRRPEEALQVFAALADASEETWNGLVASLWAALERGDDRLAQRAVEQIPRRSLARLAPEVERMADRYPGKTSLLHMLVAVYAPQAETSAEVIPGLVKLSLSHAKEVALAASLALARAVGRGARLPVAEILPLTQSRIPGVRDHLMEAVLALQKAGCSFLEADLVSLCQQLAGETNAPTLQKLCTAVGQWVHAEKRVILPVIQWAVELTRRIESGHLEAGAAGALVRALKIMAQLEDPRIASILQDAAQRMLRGIQNPNRLSVSESEMTDLLSALARVDGEFLAHLVDDGPNLPDRNVRALAFAIRRVEGPDSPLLSLMLSSSWCSPYARNAILEFKGI